MFLSSRGSRGMSSILSSSSARLELGREPRHFLAAHLAHAGVAVVLHLARGGELALQRAEGAEFLGHGGEAGIFHRQIAELALSADDGGVRQRSSDFFIAVDHFFEPQANGVFHANHCKGRRSSYSARHATKRIERVIPLAVSLAFGVTRRACCRPARSPCPPPIPTTPSSCSPTWRCRAATAAAAPSVT